VRARRTSGRQTVTATRGEVTLPPIDGQRLSVSGISKSFGGVHALKDVTFAVEPGEVVALIGPNGSGKTTLLNVVCGYYKPDSGSVVVGSTDVTGRRPHRVARAGVARTFQTPSIPSLSVRQAIAVARAHFSKVSIVETMLRLPRYGKATRADHEAVDSLLDAVGLRHAAEVDAPSLPLGTRRMLELARSLASAPTVLLLDEVASGLDDDEIHGLSAVIRAIRDSGGSVLLVEHNFALVRSLADRVVVLSRGEVVVVDTPDEVAQHPEVLEHYLGMPVRHGEPTEMEGIHG
jgi:branched-chain amino acid transport system permease protein